MTVSVKDDLQRAVEGEAAGVGSKPSRGRGAQRGAGVMDLENRPS